MFDSSSLAVHLPERHFKKYLKYFITSEWKQADQKGKLILQVEISKNCS